MKAWNSIQWTDEKIDFIKSNYHRMSNKQLSDSLDVKLTSVRMKCYELGLYKMKLEYWTDEQVEFLIDNYKTKGDTELSEIFNSKWKKEKGWTKKHIEKKRRYLNLKRTYEEQKKIREDWTKKGLYKESVRKMWLTRGKRSEGEVVVWEKNKFIKTDNRYVLLRIFNYKKHYGEIPTGMLVCHKDGNSMNCEYENLILLTREENAIKTHQIDFDLNFKETYILISRLNRKIKQINRNHGKKQITRS